MRTTTNRVRDSVPFTDLVGHTEMMSRLGDERGRAVLRDHERITREVLKAHGGTEVKTMGEAVPHETPFVVASLPRGLIAGANLVQ